jgi:hypothetical protein
MARKPNYAFERNARAAAKAQKRDAKRQAKQAAKAKTRGDAPESLDSEDRDDGAGKSQGSGASGD